METSVNIPLTILEFIVALGALLLVHEFGHFIVSVLFKIEVEEFGIGLPPRLFRFFKIGKTEFTLNAIPFGAFVRPKGENDPQVEGGLAAANPFIRLAVLFGGPFMNFMAGIILFTVFFGQVGKVDSSKVQIIEVKQNSPAAQVGLQSGDVFVKINDETIDSVDKLSSIIKSNVGSEVSIEISRNSQVMDFKATPRLNPPEGEGALGIVMGNPYVPVSLAEASQAAFLTTGEQINQIITLPAKLIQKQIPAEQARVVGPKGMWDIFVQAREYDAETEATPNSQIPAVNTLGLVASISIALGLTNLLPLPALDGGRILFLLPEIILRKRVPADKENLVHFLGLAALIILMVYLTVQDFINPVVLH